MVHDRARRQRSADADQHRTGDQPDAPHREAEGVLEVEQSRREEIARGGRADRGERARQQPSVVNSAATPCNTTRRLAPSVAASRFRSGARRASPGSQRAAR